MCPLTNVKARQFGSAAHRAWQSSAVPLEEPPLEVANTSAMFNPGRSMSYSRPPLTPDWQRLEALTGRPVVAINVQATLPRGSREKLKLRQRLSVAHELRQEARSVSRWVLLMTVPERQTLDSES